MRLRAMAKINLGLDVIRKREDGYHEVRMIMQTVRMYDTLEIRKKQAPGISLRSNLPYVPSDERNLVYKAAKILMDEFHVEEGLSMKLTKSIPVAAGMAGGSSDAAAAFVGVNRLFRKILKCSTSYIRDDDGSLHYVFGINYDISRLTMIESAVHDLVTPVNTEEKPKEITHNVNDLLNHLIEESVALVGKPVALMNKEDKVTAIQFLNDSGAFLITKSGDKVANYFGISKYTLYSYIDVNK